MARSIVIHRTGGPEVLDLHEAEVGAPGPGQVRLRQTAVGVNFIDTYHRSGLYPLPRLPHGIGMEAAGVVEAVGPGVAGLEVGQRVAYAAGPPGAYCEARLMPAAQLVPIPDGVDDAQAAAMMLKGMTVEYLVRRTFRVEPGMTVLWHAAAGGVGLIACQWLRHLGATVVGTVGSDEKAELARAHGCDHALVLGRDDVRATIRALTDGAGAHVVYDSVGRDTFDDSLASLRPRGMLVAFGNASGAPPPFDPLRLSQAGSLFLTRPKLFDYTATRDELLESAGALFKLVSAGVVRVEVRQRWPLGEAAACHRALEARETTGASVLLP